MNTQTFVRYEEHEGRIKRLYTCRNSCCDRLTTAMFCCPGCARAHGSHEIIHSSQCDERHEVRSK
jgi:hypothetical protein